MATGGIVVDMEVRAHLKDDARGAAVIGADRGPLHVVFGKLGDLRRVSSGDVVLPEIQTMFGARIREIEELITVPHRHGVGAFPVSDLTGLTGLEIQQPEIACHPAAVALPGSTIPLVGRVGDPGSTAIDCRVRAVGHRQRFGHATFGVDGKDHLGTRDAAHVSATEKQCAIRAPVAQTF